MKGASQVFCVVHKLLGNKEMELLTPLSCGHFPLKIRGKAVAWSVAHGLWEASKTLMLTLNGCVLTELNGKHRCTVCWTSLFVLKK